MPIRWLENLAASSAWLMRNEENFHRWVEPSPPKRVGPVVLRGTPF